MQSSLNYPPIASSDLEVNPAFNVVIAYEDFETGKQAKRTYDYLTQNLGQACQFSNQMWKFEILEIARLREMAAKDAAMADIIIVSGHGANLLPDGVKAWLEICVSEKGHAIALVALFGSSGGDDPANISANTAYLVDVAKRGEMEFFAQPGALPSTNKPGEAFDFSRSSVPHEQALSAISSIVQRDLSFPRWGINE